jgi:hypothetical protein
LNFLGEDISASKSPHYSGGADINSPARDFNISTFFCGGGPLEIGTIVTDIQFTWTYGREPVIYQFLSGTGTNVQVLPNEKRDYQITGQTIINNETWTLDATHETGLTDQAECTLLFGAYQYWGKIPGTEDLTGIDILTLPNSLLVTGKTSPIDFTTSAVPEWMWFAYPEAYGELGRVIDPNTNFDIPTQFLGLRTVTSPTTGYTTNYRLYRGANKTAGAFTWVFQSNSGIQLPDPGVGPTPVPPDGLLTDEGVGNDWLGVDLTDSLKVE